MGRTIIQENSFQEIITQYNNAGKTAAYDLIRSKYGVKYPNAVIARIKECGKYTYDTEFDRFLETEASLSDGVFLNLDELCVTSKRKEPCNSSGAVADPKPAAMEKLVHELLIDRLLTLSRYITVDSSARTVLIDQTSLFADGYHVVMH